MAAISPLSLKPYTTSYLDFHTGELKKITRTPPQKLHNMLPEDIVEIKSTKNLEWQEGDEHPIKHISYRSPNVLQLAKEDGTSTFMNYDEVELIEKVTYAEGELPKIDDEIQNRYLLWP